jgi:hypothetical protein
MKTLLDSYGHRFSQRSLPDLLVKKFLTEYGYDHGPVIARAIVDDILATLAQCYPDRLPPKTVDWLVVRREWQGRRKSLQVTDLVPVQLRLVTRRKLSYYAAGAAAGAESPPGLQSSPVRPLVL